MRTSLQMATRLDVGNIAALVNRAYRPESQHRGWTHEADLVAGDRISVEQVLLLFRPDSAVLVLQTKKTIVACVHVEKVACNTAQIGMLASDPKSQAQGIGKHMLACAEQFAAHKFLSTTLNMSVLSARVELIAFYERLGYRRSGTVEDYPTKAGIGQPLVDTLKVESLTKTIEKNTHHSMPLGH